LPIGAVTGRADFRLMFDGSNWTVPELASFPFTVTVPWTVASSSDADAFGAP